MTNSRPLRERAHDALTRAEAARDPDVAIAWAQIATAAAAMAERWPDPTPAPEPRRFTPHPPVVGGPA